MIKYLCLSVITLLSYVNIVKAESNPYANSIGLYHSNFLNGFDSGRHYHKQHKHSYRQTYQVYNDSNYCQPSYQLYRPHYNQLNTGEYFYTPYGNSRSQPYGRYEYSYSMGCWVQGNNRIYD